MKSNILGLIEAGLLLCLVAPLASAGMIDFIDFSDATVGCTAIAPDHYKADGVLWSTNGAAVFLFKSPINANNRFVFGSTSADPSCGDFGGNANASVIVDFVLSGTLTPGFTDTVSFSILTA